MTVARTAAVRPDEVNDDLVFPFDLVDQWLEGPRIADNDHFAVRNEILGVLEQEIGDVGRRSRR